MKPRSAETLMSTGVNSHDVQVLLFPAMKPEDQKAGALTSAAPPSAVQHPAPSSSKVHCVYF